ncbi:MAG: hypothetical protein QXL96_10705 [Ignisphaera sp.]
MRYTNLNIVSIWHIYYTVRSANIVVQHGNMYELALIFDSFASSFATPVCIAIISIVTGLEVVGCLSLFGIFTYISVLIPMIYRIGKTVNAVNLKTLHIAFLLLLSGVLFAPQFFIYSNVGLILLTLILYLFTKIITINNYRPFSLIIAFILVTLGSVIHYMPGTLLFISVFLAIFLAMLISSKFNLNNLLNKYVKYIILLYIIVTLFYFTYYGFFFYDDIHAYFETILSSLRLEPLINYTPERIKQLDEITAIVIQISRLRYLLVFIYLYGFFQALRAVHMNILSRVIIIVGAGLSVLSYVSIFIHAITDYAYRLHLFLMPIGTVTLYFAIEFFLSLLVKRRILMITFLSIIFFSTMFAVIYVLMIPIVPPSASDPRYHAEEAYTAAAFISNHLVINHSKMIIANYRYGYISSVWGIRMFVLSDWLIKYFIETDNIILILTSQNFIAPDRYTRKLTSLDYELLMLRANSLIYNTNITYILLR